MWTEASRRMGASTAGREFPLHPADLGLVPGIPYSLSSLPGVILACRAISNPRATPDVVQSQKKKKASRRDRKASNLDLNP